MTVTIDCRMLNASGIGVYLRGCLPFFLQSDNNFILLGNSLQLSEFTSPYSKNNIEIIDCKIKTFSLTELFFFPIKILKKINKADCYYSPFFNIPCGINIPIYTTIHDIIFPDMPELLSKIGLVVRMWFFRRAYKKSNKIFTVSYFSKSRIEHHLGFQKPVIVTHSAIQPMFLKNNSSLKNKTKKETIIFIGNIKKHKGLYCLLQAYHLAKKEGLTHKLIIIGSKDNFRSSDNTVIKKISEIGEESISFSGFVSDETLMEYLSSAALLIQPSLYEGFCLPPLEAMVLGTQALISDIPVLKEVYSEFPVVFFKTGDSNDLKKHLIELLLNKTINAISLPQNLISKYTFEKSSYVILNNINN